MKRWLAGLALVGMGAALSGCYYDPGYSYVRASGGSGDAYYGDGGGAYYVAPTYRGSYYGDGYYGGYGYGSGISIGISSGWFGGSYDRPHRGGYRHDHHRRDRGHGGHRGDHRHDGRGDRHHHRR